LFCDITPSAQEKFARKFARNFQFVNSVGTQYTPRLPAPIYGLVLLRTQGAVDRLTLIAAGIAFMGKGFKDCFGSWMEIEKLQKGTEKGSA
jgi:hypothetical protein